MNTNDVKDAVLAAGTSGGGIMLSFMDWANPYLKFTGLCLGVIVPLVILIKHIRHWNEKP
jgi:hypothetical protein